MDIEQKLKEANILIVDDNPQNLRVLGKLLGSNGFQISMAQSGEQTLTSVERDRPDLILLDVMMPGMDGFETCRQLKESPKTQSIPVIFLTAKADVEEVTQGLQAGAVDYVTKPFNSTELLARVNTQLQLRFSNAALEASSAALKEVNRQLESDLNLAAQFQRNLLSVVENVSYLDISYKFFPLQKVSGDMYDMSLGPENQFRFFIGDATGHGITAAFMTMMLEIGLGSISPDLSIPESMDKLNRLLLSRNTQRFITGLCFRIDSDGRMLMANAGHPPLLVIPRQEEPIKVFKVHGLPLGVDFEVQPSYKQEGYTLKNGDKIFTYTDGLTEWRDTEGRIYGERRLHSFLETHRNLDSALLLEKLMEELYELTQSKKCQDDLTIFCFQYHDSPR